MISKSLMVSMSVYVLVALLAAMHGSTPASAMPLEDDNTDIDDKRSMLLSKYMALMNRLQEQRQQEGDLSDLVGSPYVQQRSQKRFKSPMQSRSGGMSLCLWKVCPAAPWLISK
ncbi:uncharacterized protein LOC106013717 [Aplysia californica]|uniref:Uncharacterized protein LOC106013717 n=1 Tax=Aplysia californica TaxID=6500 RepID=A0ABM1ADJ8_APLCA|nr:uncharacterized protein LOC106013717 [Aplysia californica]